MNGRWKHPLNVMVALTVVFTLCVWIAEVFLGVADKLATMNNEEGSLLFKKNWPYLIAGGIWITLFSAGLVGFFVNLSQMFRVGVSRVVDFSMMNSLTKEDTQALDMWLNSNTYGPEHLKELWGYRNE